MRKYTLVFSVIAHLGVIAAVYIAPAFATDELPEPPRTTAFIIVRPVLPDPPPVAVVRNTPAPSNAAPIEPPDGVKPEPAVPVDSTPRDDPGAMINGPLIIGVPPKVEPIPAPPSPPSPKTPVPVGVMIQPPKKLVHVAPLYPPIALAAHKSGLVILQAVIDEDGSVREVKVLRSDPLFDEAAKDAVRQWRFTPSLLRGQPVPVVMTVTVGFTATN
jgi:periplasmic protein TonB